MPANHDARERSRDSELNAALPKKSDRVPKSSPSQKRNSPNTDDSGFHMSSKEKAMDQAMIASIVG